MLLEAIFTRQAEEANNVHMLLDAVAVETQVFRLGFTAVVQQEELPKLLGEFDAELAFKANDVGRCNG